jgi:hypothetical protein
MKMGNSRLGTQGVKAYPLYSRSSPRMDLPQGWQSQTPMDSHEQTARCISSESGWASGSSGGLTSEPRGAVTHAAQSRRWRPGKAIGAGGLDVQFWALVS